MADTQATSGLLSPVIVQKKVALSFGLFAVAFEIKKNQIKKRYPGLSDSEHIRLTHQLFKNT